MQAAPLRGRLHVDPYLAASKYGTIKMPENKLSASRNVA